MKSSLKNMILVMLGITLVCSAAVGGVYTLTFATIEQAKAQKLKSAYGEVLPSFDELECGEVELLGEKMNVNVASAAGSVVGYAVESNASGFGGTIKMVVGFDTEGTVTGVKVLEQAETPGLGDLISKPGSKVERSIVGRNPGKIKMAVTKDGGDVDALTAATITSRAYVSAVDKAFNAYLTKTQGAAADGYSGATELATPAEEQKGGNDE
jgi:electron transport complex protein RnfG